MDGLRRKITKFPQKSAPHVQPEPYVASNNRNKDIFISSSEAESMERHEKVFRKRSWIKKFIFFLFVSALLLLAAYGLYFSWKTYAVSRKINYESSAQQKTTLAEYARAIVSPIISSARSPLKGEEKGRINILLLGAAGEKKPGRDLTDTIMIMSVDTKNKKMSLLSLPRDLYVNIPDSESYAKINTLYPIGLKQNEGVNLIKSAAKEITGLEINYYLVVDFDGFEKIINDIGGINITNERDIYDPRYPGPNYSYETFSLSKGFHTLDGATALKYVRERHNDPDGDFGRAKRQQQVIQSVKNKIFSAKTFLNVLAVNELLNTLGDSVRTDIPFEEIDDFLDLSQEVDMQNINNVVVDAWEKKSLLKVSHVPTNSGMMFILIPRVGNYSEIQDLAENIFNLNAIKKRQEEIAAEGARIAIVNQSNDNQLVYKIQTLIKDKLELKDVDIIGSKNKKSLSKTTAFDNTNGTKLFALDELIKKLPASLSTEVPDIKDLDKYDIVITIGSDLIDVYKYEENTMQDLENAEQDNIDFIK